MRQHLEQAQTGAAILGLPRQAAIAIGLTDQDLEGSVAFLGPIEMIFNAGASSTVMAEDAAVTEGIYQFQSASGKTYVGQSGNIPVRIDQHLDSGKLLEEDLGTVQVTEVLGGKTAREIAEQLQINSLGGIQNLENIRNPIGPNRQHLMPK